MDRDAINFSSRERTSERIEKDRRTMLEAVKMIYEKGRGEAAKVYGQNYFSIAETPVYMKELGIGGQVFSISYGVISRHYDKDIDHYLPIGVWEKLPDALQTPFAITKRYIIKTNEETGEVTKEFAGYRLYTKIGMNNGFVIVGVEVKNMGMNLEVNSIRTVFSRRRKGELEEEIYRDHDITQEQSEFLSKAGDNGDIKTTPK